MLEAARQYTPDRYAEIVTVAFTGMRPGELYALRWEDVDFARSRINIEHAVSLGVIQSSTKTGVGRECPMPEAVAEALTAHRALMLREQRPGVESGLVFPSDVGTPRHGSSMTKCWLLIEDAMGADVRVGFQILRRTFNTLLIEVGADRIVQRSIMGHSSEQMTERYAGVRLESKRDALHKLVHLTKGGDD